MVLCVESPAHSPQPQPQSQPQSGHSTRANLVHMYDAQDMKKKRDVGERSADSVVSFGLSLGHPSSESCNDALAPEDFKKFRIYVRLSTMIFFFLIPLLSLDPVR